MGGRHMDLLFKRKKEIHRYDDIIDRENNGSMSDVSSMICYLWSIKATRARADQILHCPLGHCIQSNCHDQMLLSRE